MWSVIFILVGLYALLMGDGRIAWLSGLSLLLTGLSNYMGLSPTGAYSFLYALLFFSFPILMIGKQSLNSWRCIVVMVGMLGFSLWEILYCSYWLLGINIELFDIPANLVFFLTIIIGSTGGSNGRLYQRLPDLCNDFLNGVGRFTSTKHRL